MATYAANLSRTADLVMVLREKRQAAAASLQVIVRQLEREPLVQGTDPEISALWASLLQARDALLAPVPTDGDRRAERELQRVLGLQQLGRRRDPRVEAGDQVGPLPVVLTP
ncbi:hypothetical protein [Synechococcus sp. CCAP 1479/9]|uniref:hypothetical protein n=1 Tax=Synechococcus sp. CCAP 1479/9 TaxID=1221593 RepID=UPI001C24DFEE|nr:hypothetical protein [Synechococcus sp. CCAP 1479/9]